MTDEELLDALDGFLAWDEGSTDSGIQDNILRERVRNYLHSIDPTERVRLCAAFVGMYPAGEDADEARDWLHDEMGMDV